MLNTSYDHGCHLASQFCLDPEDYEVVSPLVMSPVSHLLVPAGCCIVSCCPLIALPSHCIVAPAGCRIASSCRPLVTPPSRPLVAPDCCRITSLHPLVAPPSPPHVGPAGWCVASQRAALLVISSSCCAALSSSCPASWCSHHLSSSSRCAALSSSHHAGWLLRCLFFAPPSHPLVVPAIFASPSPCHSPSKTPPNTVKCCRYHRMPPPLSPLNVISIVHCCHSSRPTQPSNTNSHLRPSTPSNADARCRHLPPLVSIAIFASTSPIRSPSPTPSKSCCRH